MFWRLGKEEDKFIEKPMNIELWKEIFNSSRIIWKRHALQRMAERDISRSHVLETIISGKCIEYDAEDFPFPSALFSESFDNRPIHVVAAIDEKEKWGFVITAYEPDLQHFQSGYTKRKEKGD